MDKYTYFEIEDSNISGYLFLNTSDDFYYYMKEISKRLKIKYGDNFSIIVDHFLTNGFSFNRFLRLDWNGDNFKTSLVHDSEINKKYEKLIKEYISNNIILLDKSSLSELAIDTMKEIMLNK